VRPPGASHGSARSRVPPRARSRPPGRCCNLSSSPEAAPHSAHFQPSGRAARHWPATRRGGGAALGGGGARGGAPAAGSAVQVPAPGGRVAPAARAALPRAAAAAGMPLCACRSVARAPGHSQCLGGGICRSRVRAAASGQLLPHRGGNKERLNAAVAELFTHSAGRLPALQARCLPPPPPAQRAAAYHLLPSRGCATRRGAHPPG
jgi:hypothetical protein